MESDKGLSQESKDKFVAFLTLSLASAYMIACLVGLWYGKLDFKEFSTSVAPWVSLLLGYWLRGLALS